MNGLERATKRFVRRYMRGKERRLHLTLKSDFNREIFRGKKSQWVERKPIGLWYGFNDSWINWCLAEQPNWLTPYIYEIVLKEDRIKKINGLDEFDAFEKEYAASMELDDWFSLTSSFSSRFGADRINYTKLVTDGYHGIEINPYLWERRLSRMWYYGWDCASGCVWNKRSILDVRLFGRFDKTKNEFVKCTNRPAGLL